MDPDFVMSKTDMGRKLLFAFIDHEVETEAKNPPNGGSKSSKNKLKGKGGR